MNINKFTQKSIQAVNGLEKTAYEYGNQELEQEHLLMSLLRKEYSLILKLISKMEIQPEHFVNRVERYPYAMDLSRGSVVVDAKSLLGVMILGFNQVMNLNVYAEDCGQLFQDIKPYIAA